MILMRDRSSLFRKPERAVSQQQLAIEAQLIYDELLLSKTRKIALDHASVPKLLCFQFMNGVPFARGSIEHRIVWARIVGATIVVSMLARLHSLIKAAPCIAGRLK